MTTTSIERSFMAELQVTRFDLPALPAPKPGDDPIFVWDTYAEVRVAELVAVVRRFAYWDEHDGKPLEVGYEAYVEGLPETGGVADIVATHPDVFDDLSGLCAKAAVLLRECRSACLNCLDERQVQYTNGKRTWTEPCEHCQPEGAR